ncbi:MAG: hypothetical protein AAFQ07_05515, partial [Chloroflexota bacterium]
SSAVSITDIDNDAIHTFDLAAVIPGANADYHNNVAAVGEDATSTLAQYKSKSQDATGIITIEALDANIDDLEFLVWGNNSGDASAWTTTPSTLGVPSGYERINRAWRVQETGDVGTVTITLDTNDADIDLPNITGADGNLYFVRDATTADDDLSNETPIQMYDDATNGDTVSGDGIYAISGIDFADGQEFTFAQLTGPAPGAEKSNLVGWWKANKGVYANVDKTVLSSADAEGDVKLWEDQSGLGYDLIDPSGADSDNQVNPYYGGTTNYTLNFNPTINIGRNGGDATGSNQGLAVNNYNDWPTTAITTYVVAQHTEGNVIDAEEHLINYYQVTGTTDANNDYWVYTDTAGDVFAEADSNASAVTEIDVNVESTQPAFLTSHIGGTSTSQLYLNGGARAYFQGPANAVGAMPQGGCLYIGEDQSDNGCDGGSLDGNQDWDGTIAEVIIYAENQGATQRRKVESYLALKYGLTLDRQYSSVGAPEQLLDTNGATSTGAVPSIGQTFTAPGSGTVTSIDFSVDPVNTLGTYDIHFCDASTSTNLTLCAATPDYTESGVAVVNGVQAVNLGTPFPVTAGTKYMIVFEGTGAGTVALRVDNTNPYAFGGLVAASTESTVTDLYFDVIGTFTVDGIATPGTYDYIASDGTSLMWDSSKATSGTEIDLDSFEYTGDFFDVGGRETQPSDVLWNNDGTKFYITGIDGTGDHMQQYDLSTPYDIGTATDGPTNNGYDPTGQDGSPRGMHFDDDGDRLFMIGSATETVYEYALSTPYDVDNLSVSYTSNFFDIDAFTGDSNPEFQGIDFSNDGLKMFVVGSTVDRIYEFTLTAAYDISAPTLTAQYSLDSDSFDANADPAATD